MTKEQIIERLQSATTLLVRAQRAVEGSVTSESAGDILDDVEDDIRAVRAALAAVVDDRHLPPREQKTTAHGKAMAAATRR